MEHLLKAHEHMQHAMKSMKDHAEKHGVKLPEHSEGEGESMSAGDESGEVNMNDQESSSPENETGFKGTSHKGMFK